VGVGVRWKRYRGGDGSRDWSHLLTHFDSWDRKRWQTDEAIQLLHEKVIFLLVFFVVRDERYTTKSNLTQMSTDTLRLAPSTPSPQIPSSSSRKGKKNQSSINQSRRREKEGTISPCSSVMRRSLPRPRSSILCPPWLVAVVSRTLLFHTLHHWWK